MKKMLFLFACLLLLAPLAAHGEEAKYDLTLMVYMCGSNLESEYGSASEDIREMLSSGCDFSRTKVLVMTGGSTRWDSAIEPDRLTVLELGARGMRPVWQDEAADMGEPATLTRLLETGIGSFPAKQYALILWDHGGGPMAGMCWDELFSLDNLTLGELIRALRDAKLSEKLSWIGFDACLMGSVEVASTLAPYAKYMIASQETEPAAGWNYQFLKEVGACADGAAAGRLIVDAYFEGREDSRDALTLACVDLSRVGAIEQEMNSFFSGVSAGLTRGSYALLSGVRRDTASFGDALRGEEDMSYDLVDLHDLVSHLGHAPQAVEAALDGAVVCARSNVGEACGLSVYHPYANKRRYQEEWREDYDELNFSAAYTQYIRRFAGLLTDEPMASWAHLEAVEEGVDGAAQEFSLQLTEEQAACFSSAQLMILQPTFGYERGVPRSLSPLSVEPATLTEDGRLTARYAGRALYVTDEAGNALAGPVGFLLSDDGQTYSILATYHDYSGRHPSREDTAVVYQGALDADTGFLDIQRVYVFDRTSGTYTNRIPFSEEGYTQAAFHRFLRQIPQGLEELPGYNAWEHLESSYYGETIDVPSSWQLRFFDDQFGREAAYASFQITDIQQNTWSSQPLRFEAPDTISLPVSPDAVEAGGVSARLGATLSATAGLALHLEVENRGDHPVTLDSIYSKAFLVLNGAREFGRTASFDRDSVSPGESAVLTMTLSGHDLAGLERLESARFQLEARSADDPLEKEELALSFAFPAQDITSLAEDRLQALSEAEADGVLWRLTRLSYSPGDAFLRGELYVENKSGQDLDESLRVLTEGVLLEGQPDVMLAAGHARFVEFSLSNIAPVSSFDLTLQGDYKLYLAGMEDPLAQAGVHEIRSIELLPGYGPGYAGQGIQLALTEPLALGNEAFSPPKRASLLTGDVQVEVEAAFIADDGLALGLRVKNDTGRNCDLTACVPELDGADDCAFSLSSDAFIVPAGAEMYDWLVLRVPEAAPGQAAGELRFLLRNGDYMQKSLCVTFPEGFAFGQPDGVYLDAEQLGIRAVAYEERPLALSGAFDGERSAGARPFVVNTPLTEEELAGATTAQAFLCLAAGEGEIGADTGLIPVVGANILRDGEGGTACAFSGLAIEAAGGILCSFETLKEGLRWNILAIDHLYFFSDADDLSAARGHRIDPKAALSAWIQAGVAWEDGHLALEATTLEIMGADASLPGGQQGLRKNYTLDEVGLALLERNVHHPFSEVETELVQSPLSLTEPLQVSLVGLDGLGKTYLYVTATFEDGSTREVLLDRESGEILLEERS